MPVETQSEPLNKSWISAHPLVVIGLVLLMCLTPFLNQAIQTDDALFVWSAEWIQKHPGDFYGFSVNWWGSAIPMWVANYNPPLMSYFLTCVGSILGWSEVILHLACVPLAFVAAAGIYALAKMWCERPLLATLVAIFTPAFLVSSTTLMCDVLMLNFWIWAVVLWERALNCEKSTWLFVGAGTMAGLAVLTKYSAITLLPLLPVLSLLRTRKFSCWSTAMLMPLIMVAAYEWTTAKLYGQGLLTLAGHYAQSHQFGFSGGWKAKGIIGLAFAGGSLLPLLFFVPFLWRKKTLITAGIVLLGTLLGTSWLSGDLGLIHPWFNAQASKYWGFQLQIALLAVGGLHLLLLAATVAWRQRDAISLMLALWIANVFLFATVLNWTVSARSFLPAVPAATILLVRRLKAARENSNDQYLWLPLMPAAGITLVLLAANYQLANSTRTAATKITAEYKTTDHNLWIEGHGGFQYYMEKLGCRQVDVEKSLLLPGDIVVASWLGGSTVTLPLGSVGVVENILQPIQSWVNLQGSSTHGSAGFYTSDWGPVPFVFEKNPLQEYFIARVFSRVQYKSEPDNPKEVQAGAVPSFSHLAYAMDEGPTFPLNPAATEPIRAASRFEKDGKIEEAIQQYTDVLQIDSNNPVALNNLALIRATAANPRLRNGKEAVRLATRAVELTELRQPGVIATLAAAYAETGDFAKAVTLAEIARSLAMATGQQDQAAIDARLVNRYSSDKVKASSSGP